MTARSAAPSHSFSTKLETRVALRSVLALSALSVLCEVCCSRDYALDASQRRSSTVVPSSITVPAGPGVTGQARSGNIYIQCQNVGGNQPIPNEPHLLREGATLGEGIMSLRGIGDKGFVATVGSDSVTVYMSYGTLCSVHVGGRVLADLYNPGADNPRTRVRDIIVMIERM